ncbi:unnamed protein product [Effrenium voratum]|nr:unnamed protein product [Effrenium voratum]
MCKLRLPGLRSEVKALRFLGRAALGRAVKSLAERGRLSLALRILGEEGIVLDAPSFTAGITAFGQSKSWQEACRLFASMPEAKIQQDLISFNATISACKQSLQWQGALQLLGDMARARVRPDAVSWSTAISSCKGQRSYAWTLFQAMETRPDVICYNATINALAAGRQWQPALHLFHAMRSTQIRPTKVTYTSTWQACDTPTTWPLALQIFRSAESDGHTILLGCSWQLALAALHAMESEDDPVEARAGPRGPRLGIPSLASYTSAIRACARGAQLDAALRALQSSGRRRQPDVVLYSA